MAAALELEARGKQVAVVEREESLGGILTQCIHNGFGLIEFNEELTGPEFAERFAERVAGTKIVSFCRTTVIELDAEGESKTLTCVSAESRCAPSPFEGGRSRNGMQGKEPREYQDSRFAAGGGLYGRTRPAAGQYRRLCSRKRRRHHRFGGYRPHHGATNELDRLQGSCRGRDHCPTFRADAQHSPVPP